MSNLSLFSFDLSDQRSFDFIALFKILTLSFLATLFFFEINLWQVILSEGLYSRKIITLLFGFTSFFALYNLKESLKWKQLVFIICVLDLLFLTFYSFYNPLPLNLFVGLLSLNILISGLFLSFSETLFVLCASIFSFTLYLGNKDLLASPYSVVYFAFNTSSFVLYAVASWFLQRFFLQNKGEVNILSQKLFNQTELNDAVLSSIDSAVLTGSSKVLRPLNERAKTFLEKTKPAFLSHLNEKGSEVVSDFESDGFYFKVHESSLKIEDVSLSSDEKIWLVTDETDDHKNQKELEKTRKLSAIGTLSAGLAHEIRNPLAGISGSVELIKEGAVDAQDSKKLFNTVLREIDRLNLLVTDFLSFAQPEVKCADTIETKSFFEDLVSFIKLDKRAESIKINLYVENTELKVDENKFKQVFINLIINAVQAFSKEQSQYSNAPEVVVKARNLDSGYEIKVEDNGDGIKKANLDSIFEPFHTTKDKGTGLGLALTHRILEGHGASIGVESEPDVGTTFTILFKK